MKKGDLFVLIVVLLFVAIGTFLPEKVENLLSRIRESLLPQGTEFLLEEPEEPLDITLPDISQELSEIKPIMEPLTQGPTEFIESPIGEEAIALGKPVSVSEESMPRLSFFQIKERVNEIEQEKEIIAIEVFKLVEASEAKAIAGEVWVSAGEKGPGQEAQITEIQEQIKDILGQIAAISAQITVLTETPNTGA